MGQVVLRFRKVKTSTDLGNVANHNSRGKVIDDTGGWKDGSPPEWMRHPERNRFNEGQQGRRDDSAVKMWHRIVDGAGLKRKPQENASKAIEAVFTASSGTFKTVKEWKKFLNEGLEYLKERLGTANCLQWNMHFDEKTPHLHVLFVPIVRDYDKGHRYSSAEFLGGPEGLRGMQSAIFEEVGKKYGLSRGEPSDKKHTDQSQWKSELIKKEKGLEELDKKIADYKKELDQRSEDLKKQWEDTEAKVGVLVGRENAVNNTLKNMPQAQQIATRLAENLHGSTPPEIQKFWPRFWEKVPAFIDGIKAEVKAELATENRQSMHVEARGKGR